MVSGNRFQLKGDAADRSRNAAVLMEKVGTPGHSWAVFDVQWWLVP